MAGGPHAGRVERTGVVLVTVSAVALAGLLILAFVAGPPSSRVVSLEELRAGVEFSLGGVRVQETYFHDLSMIDAGTEVAFLLHFPDATSENVSIVYRTFACVDVTAASVHRDPQVIFRGYCGQDSVLVSVS